MSADEAGAGVLWAGCSGGGPAGPSLQGGSCARAVILCECRPESRLRLGVRKEPSAGGDDLRHGCSEPTRHSPGALPLLTEPIA